MNDKFDELAKGMAQSVTRRQALRRFAVGLAGIGLAILTGKANASGGGGKGNQVYCHQVFCQGYFGHSTSYQCADKSLGRRLQRDCTPDFCCVDQGPADCALCSNACC